LAGALRFASNISVPWRVAGDRHDAPNCGTGRERGDRRVGRSSHPRQVIARPQTRSRARKWTFYNKQLQQRRIDLSVSIVAPSAGVYGPAGSNDLQHVSHTEGRRHEPCARASELPEWASSLNRRYFKMADESAVRVERSKPRGGFARGILVKRLRPREPQMTCLSRSFIGRSGPATRSAQVFRIGLATFGPEILPEFAWPETDWKEQ
jgi:hypothetical protein